MVLLLGVAAAACGGKPSLTEYAAEMETAVYDMNAQIDALGAEVSGSPDLEQLKHYWTERVRVRDEFMAILESLDPPDQVRDLHESSLGIIGRLTNAETDLADYVSGLDSPTDFDAIWSSPLGVAATTADTEAIALCQAAQADFDRTKERADLSDVPWIPPELREVVTVAFGCLAEERQGNSTGG